MKYSAKHLSQTVVQLCLEKGIHHIVISPGSRNAPLTIGFTQHPDFHCYSIVDERCAAFVALGMAQQLHQPVALVCTSGSALLNYFPAVAEAYYSQIPIVVLSADRPSELIDIGDGQTIQQEKVYGKHVLYSACCTEGEAHQESNEREINKALNTALESMGPVHINVPLSEPLYELVLEPSVRPKNIPPKPLEPQLEAHEISSLATTWKAFPKKIILVGVMPPNSIDAQWIEQMGGLEDTLVLTETTSNIQHPNFFPYIDQLISTLSEEEKGDLQPDLLLTFGGMIVSKRIKAFLRNHKPKQHWHVDPYIARDTYFSLSHHIKSTPNDFLAALLPEIGHTESDFLNKWLAVQKYRVDQQAEFEKEVDYTDFWVYKEVFKNLPKNGVLHLANSTAIRYAQLFPMDPSQAVFCNRGTSGIDGSSSTAIGAGMISNKPVVLVTGDLSFFYDSNALWNPYVPKNFKIILVNNSGGGIFRILPKAQEMEHFERYFETQHNLTAKALCSMHGWGYRVVTNKTELHDSLPLHFEDSSKPQLLEICTPPTLNDKVLKAYFKAIS